MITHSSPGPGATTSQLAANEPAGNPAISTGHPPLGEAQWFDRRCWYRLPTYHQRDEPITEPSQPATSRYDSRSFADQHGGTHWRGGQQAWRGRRNASAGLPARNTSGSKPDVSTMPGAGAAA